jgi:putative PIN family toxin of toxin-antitoxin system
MRTVVIDTNVLVAALHGQGGMSRKVVRACLTGELQPVFGAALQFEYEDVFSRSALWSTAATSTPDREVLLNAFLSRCRWVEVFFAWRPNLPDEADNHLIELGLAAQAEAIVTKNLRDLKRGELAFPSLKVLTPKEVWENFLCRH